MPNVRRRIARWNKSASLLLSSRIIQFGEGQDIMEWVLESRSSWDPTDLSTNHTPQSVQLTYFTHTHWSNNRLALGPNVNMAEPCSSFLQGAALSARPCSVRAFWVLGSNVNTTKPCNFAHEAVWRKLGPLVLIRGYLLSSSVGPQA